MYHPADDRYEKMTCRRCGRSGVLLSGILLGLWHNFGSLTPFTDQQAMLSLSVPGQRKHNSYKRKRSS